MTLNLRPLILALFFASIASAATLDQSLIDAVKREDATTVRSLIARKASVKATEADGSTALHWAAQRNNMKLVDALLTAGADVKAATRYNITPFYFACLNGNLAM